MINLKERLIFKIYHFIELIFIKINSMFKSKGIIVMFHHITNEDLDIMSCCKCKVDRFSTIINHLIENYELIHLRNLYTNDSKKKIAIITFDDGCKDVYTNAYPILKMYKIPFTVYVTQDFINKPGYMTEDELLSLDKDPLVTIGYHTKTHVKLRFCKNKESECSPRKLANFLAKDILNFAYPYGKLHEIGFKSIFFISMGKYDNAVGTIDAPLTKFSLLFRYYLPRVVIE